MNYPLFLATRLSLGNDGKRISPAVIVAILSISISVGVMLASIAIVLGFKKEIRDKVVGFNGHISVFRMPESEEDDNIIRINDFLKSILAENPFVKEYYVQAAIPAIMKTSDDFKGVYLRGLQGESSKEYLRKNLEKGVVPDYTDDDENEKILISEIAARQLRLDTGDRIETYFISDEIRVRKLEVSGIYNTHFDQYDDVLIFGSMPLVSKLGNLPDSAGTYIVIQTDNFDKIADYTLKLQEQFNQAIALGETSSFYRTDNVLSQGRGFFSWLSLLDTNVVVIIILMMVVGCVTLVSGMLIIILERKKFIGLMRALGSDTAKIRLVFIFMAVRISLLGIIIGDILSVLILFIQKHYHFIPLDADSYYINFVPVYLPGWIIAVLNGGVLLVSYLVLVLPSKFVSKISPAESMLRSD